MPGARVSVVIPCWNYAVYLSDAIESVLAQTRAADEIIVVDDGSTDNTAEVVRRYPGTIYLYQPNRGLAAARNAGLQRSRGEYLVFLDADDRLLPCAINYGAAALNDNPNAIMVAGSYRLIGADGAPVDESWNVSHNGDPYCELLRRNCIAMTHSVMFRRNAFEQVGLFNETLPVCEDYDLYLRMARRFPIVFYDDVVAEYRRHANNMSRNAGLMLTTVLQVLRSQRRLLKNDDEVRAYREGLKNWRALYGRAAARQCWQRATQPGNRVLALRGLLSLLRDAPAELPAIASEFLFKPAQSR